VINLHDTNKLLKILSHFKRESYKILKVFVTYWLWSRPYFTR